MRTAGWRAYLPVGTVSTAESCVQAPRCAGHTSSVSLQTVDHRLLSFRYGLIRYDQGQDIDVAVADADRRVESSPAAHSAISESCPQWHDHPRTNVLRAAHACSPPSSQALNVDARRIVGACGVDLALDTVLCTAPPHLLLRGRISRAGGSTCCRLGTCLWWLAAHLTLLLRLTRMWRWRLAPFSTHLAE